MYHSKSISLLPPQITSGWNRSWETPELSPSGAADPAEPQCGLHQLPAANTKRTSSLIYCDKASTPPRPDSMGNFSHTHTRTRTRTHTHTYTGTRTLNSLSTSLEGIQLRLLISIKSPYLEQGAPVAPLRRSAASTRTDAPPRCVIRRALLCVWVVRVCVCEER